MALIRYAKKAPTVVVGAFFVLALGCSSQAIDERGPGDMPNGRPVPIWSGEPLEKAVAAYGPPQRTGDRVVWIGKVWRAEATVDGGLLVDVTVTYPT